MTSGIHPAHRCSWCGRNWPLDRFDARSRRNVGRGRMNCLACRAANTRSLRRSRKSGDIQKQGARGLIVSIPPGCTWVANRIFDWWDLEQSAAGGVMWPGKVIKKIRGSYERTYIVRENHIYPDRQILQEVK